MNKTAQRAVQGIFALLLAYLFFRIFRETILKGNDFKVFYRTANYVLQGLPTYDLVRDKALTFKYPPWILPVFFPFALLPFFWAKALWAAIQTASLIYCWHWLYQRGCRWLSIATVTVAFSGILIVHAMDAQVTLPTLALLLFCAKPHALSFWAASIKVFTLLPLLEFLRAEHRPQLKKSLLYTPFILLVLSLPALWTQADRSWPQLTRDYVEVAQSGGKAFKGNKVRSRENQGLPALILRQLKVPKENSRADSQVALLFFILFGFAWWKLSGPRRAALPLHERWLGALALTTVLQPLAWFHSFVWALPLMVYLVDLSFRSHSTVNKGFKCLVLLSLLMICGVTRRTMGPIGYHLELLSIKSIGVILALSLFLLLKQRMLIKK